jgi:hypothetical protein
MVFTDVTDYPERKSIPIVWWRNSGRGREPPPEEANLINGRIKRGPRSADEATDQRLDRWAIKFAAANFYLLFFSERMVRWMK